MIRIERETIGRGTPVRMHSVFAGTCVTLGFGLMFLLLGNAVGLSAVETVNPLATGAIRFWSGIFTAATLILSFYLGGIFSSRDAEIPDSASGALHGAVAWGLSCIVAAALVYGLNETARRIMDGTDVGNTYGRWLAFAVTAIGLGASVMGGMSGKAQARSSREGPMVIPVEEDIRPTKIA